MTRRPRWFTAAEAVLVVIACVAVVALSHDIAYVLKAPYWLDEAWVAVSARLPVTDLLHVTSSTPPGWNLLQRAFVPFGDQVARLLPLAFIAGSGIVAYYASVELVRERTPLPRLVGSLAALSVMLVPAALARNDLKQYTCDGFVALAVVLCAAIAARRDWPTWSLWMLAAVGILGFAISIPTVFLLAAVGLVWLITMLVTRDWKALLRGTAPFGTLIVVAGALYLGVYAPASNPALNDYWNPFYPSLAELPTYLLTHLREVGPLLTFGRWWPTAIGVVVAVLMMAIRWRSVIAYVPIALAVLVVGAGVAHRYPLLDARTSHFFFVTMTFFGAVGGVSLVLVACTAWLKRRALVWTIAVGITVAGALVVSVAAAPEARAHTIPGEDARSQVRYVQAHAAPGDIILLNRYAGYAFGYYWTRDEPGWKPDSAFATDFQITYPASAGVVIATDDDPSWVTKAASEAAARGVRLWVVRTHMTPDARQAWDKAMPGATSIPTGSEPLAVVGQ